MRSRRNKGCMARYQTTLQVSEVLGFSSDNNALCKVWISKYMQTCKSKWSSGGKAARLHLRASVCARVPDIWIASQRLRNLENQMFPNPTPLASLVLIGGSLTPRSNAQLCRVGSRCLHSRSFCICGLPRGITCVGLNTSRRRSRMQIPRRTRNNPLRPTLKL